MKYLLSTGETTDRVEKYILDLLRIELIVMPGDIPGNRGIGSDFNLVGVTKQDLSSEINSRINNIIDKIKSQFQLVEIEVTKFNLISETTAIVELTVAGNEIGEFELSI